MKDSLQVIRDVPALKVSPRQSNRLGLRNLKNTLLFKQRFQLKTYYLFSRSRPASPEYSPMIQQKPRSPKTPMIAQSEDPIPTINEEDPMPTPVNNPVQTKQLELLQTPEKGQTLLDKQATAVTRISDSTTFVNKLKLSRDRFNKKIYFYNKKPQPLFNYKSAIQRLND